LVTTIHVITPATPRITPEMITRMARMRSGPVEARRRAVSGT
jgi:hypothetical protein